MDSIRHGREGRHERINPDCWRRIGDFGLGEQYIQACSCHIRRGHLRQTGTGHRLAQGVRDGRRDPDGGRRGRVGRLGGRGGRLDRCRKRNRGGCNSRCRWAACLAGDKQQNTGKHAKVKGNVLSHHAAPFHFAVNFDSANLNFLRATGSIVTPSPGPAGTSIVLPGSSTKRSRVISSA